jgi:plastocyanin
MEAAADNTAAIPVERSTTTVDAKLEDLRTGGYAINIHKSTADIGTYIACGNLTGDVDPTGALVVGLRELNDSGYAGIAILTSDGAQTEVNVYLADGIAGAGTAGSTTSDQSAATAGATKVEIANLAYNPAQITIAAGSTVTWTNDDTVPHTVTARDRSVLQSGTLNPGDSFSQTFTTPGAIEYFCEFHANMKGTIVVQ